MPSSHHPAHYWVVSAINRLTRQRENITQPLDRPTAERLCTKQKAIRPAKRFWLYPMVKPTPWREEQLHF